MFETHQAFEKYFYHYSSLSHRHMRYTIILFLISRAILMVVLSKQILACLSNIFCSQAKIWSSELHHAVANIRVLADDAPLLELLALPALLSAAQKYK